MFSSVNEAGKGRIFRMKKFKHLTAVLVSLLLLALITPSHADSTVGCNQPAKAVKQVGTLVLASIPANLPTVQWGIGAGCFRKYGLEIKTSFVASTQIGFTGLISGSYDLFMNTPSNLILLMANGDLDGKIIAPRHGYSAEELARAKREPLYPGELLLQSVVLVSKDSPIKSWEDLEGRKIGIKSFKGTDHAGILLAMKSKGVKTSKFEFLALSDTQMASALSRGDVDAVVPSDPFATQMIVNGARVIGYPSAYYSEPGPAVVYISTQQIVSKKVEAMKAFQKATLEINHLLNLPQNDDSLRKTIANVTGVSLEAANKLKLPTLVEQNVSFSQIAYIPNKLKSLGFIKSRVNLAPILFH
ncbi:MAG: PhnD/SsuA/transferrin family substrate-binding protein [Actinobacteria bacterium]|nr:PhnD/SsuA/transferrin family substrate-binding protein [Actinomycetota bacterium]